MAEIKSALELALEKTENVKSSKETIKTHEYINKGKKLASSVLKDPEEIDVFAKAIKISSGKERSLIKEGALQTLLANLILPPDKSSENNLSLLEKTFNIIINDKKKVSYIFQQLNKFYTQYFENKDQLLENIKVQFGPKLREKEEALSNQLGIEVHLDPSQDPGFTEIFNNNLSQLKQQFQEVLNKIKAEIAKLFAESK